MPDALDRDWPPLTLSASSAKTDDDPQSTEWRWCWRAYFLRTYWTWQAWNRGRFRNVKSRRLAYALKTAISVKPYAGTIVHWIAAWVLRRTVDGQSIPEVDVLRHMVIERFREGLESASQRTELNASKKRPMSLDVFYDGEINADDLDEAETTIRHSIGELMFNDHVGVVAGLAAEGGRILSIEEPAKFELEVRPGVFGTVFLVTDLAYLEPPRDGIETAIVVDWKSGKKRDSDARQLELYAAWAYQHERTQTPRRVRAMAVYLATGEWSELVPAPTAEDGKAVLDRLVEFARSLEPRVVDGDLNRNEPLLGKANADAWPQLPEGSRECGWCDYRRICKRGRDGRRTAD